MNLEVMLVVALVIGFIVFRQVQKVSLEADESEQNPDMSRYTRLCGDINAEIEKLRSEAEILTLKDESKKGEFLEELSNLSKELVFIENSHSTNKNAKTWERKLFEFLSKLEGVVEKYLIDANSVNDSIRDRLFASFNG